MNSQSQGEASIRYARAQLRGLRVIRQEVDVYVEDDGEAAEIWEDYLSVKENKDWKDTSKSKGSS